MTGIEMGLEIVGAMLVGLALGLLGAGGSIITVPVLVYVVGEAPKAAIAESLLIVATIAAVAAFHYQRARLIDWRNAVLLGVPGMLGAFGGAALASFVSGRAQMILFACIAFAAAIRMLTMRDLAEATLADRRPAWQPIVAGLGVGVITGLVGVGGGFLLIPALVVLLGLPMRRAVGTSLAIIAANGLVGFAKHWHTLQATDTEIHWNVVALFAALGVVGSIAGTWLSPRLPQRALRLTFAWVLVAVSIGTLLTQMIGSTQT
ncbi:MAG: sulfite exporter TauE/SafE family protein [Phycisphaerae bacterium]|nr:sulfite exporter TauE/SafE family protein [Phycisphaerae bacterium]